MLFDTPLLSNLPPVAASAAASTGSGSKKRKHGHVNSSSSSNSSKEQMAAGAEMNLDKLMKRMKGMQSKPSESPAGLDPKLSNKKSKPAVSTTSHVSPGPSTSSRGAAQSHDHDGNLKKKVKNGKNKTVREGTDRPQPRPTPSTSRDPSSTKPPRSPKEEDIRSNNSRYSPKASARSLAPDDEVDASARAPIKSRHAAPNFDEQAVGGSSSSGAPQTSMQTALRAKLAGGKFRMLNETLYTTSGEEAWKTMKEDGAFDDYHAGFRSQAVTWPVHPLTLIKKELSASLPSLSLVADFGCGDATLARDLAKESSKKQIKVISFDLVSKDGWVVEAECSSVPLPGGRQGGQIVDAVVCCLSLMGTDWIRMVREAWRVLRPGGQLKIAEVSSRFTDIDSFVTLVSSTGFKLTGKDTSNSHFIMFDFVKAGEEALSKQAETTKKVADLLRPCIYKKR